MYFSLSLPLLSFQNGVEAHQGGKRVTENVEKLQFFYVNELEIIYSFA